MHTLYPTYSHDELRKVIPIKQLAQKVFVDEFISEYTGIPVAKINSRRRDADIFRARCLAWYLLRYEFEFYVASIGRCYERDHTTILSGLKKIEEYFGTEYLQSLGEKAISTYSQA